MVSRFYLGYYTGLYYMNPTISMIRFSYSIRKLTPRPIYIRSYGFHRNTCTNYLQVNQFLKSSLLQEQWEFQEQEKSPLIIKICGFVGTPKNSSKRPFTVQRGLLLDHFHESFQLMFSPGQLHVRLPMFLTQS